MCARRSTSIPASSTRRCGSTRCFGLALSSLNALMVTGTGALALLLWTRGQVSVGTVAMALPLAWQIVNISGWVAWQVTAIFENIGVVQEGMMTIARPITLTDGPQAQALVVTRGEIAFEDVRFHYGRAISAREEGRPHPHAVLEGFIVDGAARREDRPGRPLRRRQVDRRQSAAALLRPRRRPHPDRRPGHRRA